MELIFKSAIMWIVVDFYNSLRQSLQKRKFTEKSKVMATCL